MYATVPRIWPGETVVCVATGPSLRQADVDACRDRARVIVINDAYQNKVTSCLWADILYAHDAKWWNWHKGAPAFSGQKYSLMPHAAKWPGVQILRSLGRTGLSLNPRGLCTGHDSGYQAINLAVLSGASRILLLGYDMHGDHVFGSHPDRTRPPFVLSLEAYRTLVEPLKRAGVEVMNCTSDSALTAFPHASLAEALERAPIIVAPVTAVPDPLPLAVPDASTPQIIICTDGGAKYQRLADVLVATAAAHCPTWRVRRSVVSVVGNQPSKLRHWRDVVDAAADDTPLLLMDADAMITRPMDDIWTRLFDVAYTVRDPAWSRWPNNAGVIFCRVSDRVRAFLRRWIAADEPLLATTGDVRRRWLETHGSVEQAALEQALAASPDLQVLQLPCVEWNCEDSSWAHFEANRTRIVHVKGALRKGIFGERVSESRQRQITPLVKLWRTWDRQLHPATARHIAVRRPPPQRPRYAGVMRRTMPESPALYTKAWQETRKWTASSSSQCLGSALKMFGAPAGLLDLGCGDGHLVQEAIANRIDAVGVDLSCEGEAGPLRHADLCQPLDLDRRFPMVLCWEVAEHLPDTASDVLCDTIVRHLAPNGVLLFTAAVPGQGGKGHINEQPPAYWRDSLIARGLVFDDARTSRLAREWTTVAPKTPWYGANLQIFRAPRLAGDGPTLVLTMRTANRAPKPNYLAGTLRGLDAQGVDLTALHLCVTAPGTGWLEREIGSLPSPILHVPNRTLSANANGLAQVRVGLTTDAEWIGLLEDDLTFCADFVGSMRRWLRDHARADRHVYRCFGFTHPPSRSVEAYDWPLEQLRGSQTMFFRREDAADFLAWGSAHLTTWCRETRWRSSTADPRIAFDKFVAAWATTRWPRTPGVISHPYFVKHIGNHSSIHARGVRNDAPFAGEHWTYRAPTEATA